MRKYISVHNITDYYFDKATSTATERWRGTDYFDIFELGNPAGTYSFHSSVHHSPVPNTGSDGAYSFPLADKGYSGR